MYVTLKVRITCQSRSIIRILRSLSNKVTVELEYSRHVVRHDRMEKVIMLRMGNGVRGKGKKNIERN